jgi:hypothetical protein
MGQGMDSRHFWRCILLIAAAVQGITPDPQDLASLQLLRVIGPMLGVELGSTEGQESAVDVCEPIQVNHGSPIRRAADKIPLPEGLPIGTRAPIHSPDGHPVASHRKEDLRPHGLIPPPRRLRC